MTFEGAAGTVDGEVVAPVAIVALCSVGGASSTLMPRARGTIDGNARDVVSSQRKPFIAAGTLLVTPSGR